MTWMAWSSLVKPGHDAEFCRGAKAYRWRRLTPTAVIARESGRSSNPGVDDPIDGCSNVEGEDRVTRAVSLTLASTGSPD